MNTEEVAELRNAICKLEALVVSVASTASEIRGGDATVERTQALAELAEEQSQKILHQLDSIISARLVAA